MSRKITDEDCIKWRESPTKNPKTGKNMYKNAGVYKSYQKRCESPSPLSKGGKVATTRVKTPKVKPKSPNVDINLSDCEKWLKNKSVNPKTDRSIKEGGAVYKKIQKKCEELIVSSPKSVEKKRSLSPKAAGKEPESSFEIVSKRKKLPEKKIPWSSRRKVHVGKIRSPVKKSLSKKENYKRSNLNPHLERITTRQSSEYFLRLKGIEFNKEAFQEWKEETQPEELINNLHFIWIGSAMVKAKEKNFQKWILKQTCPYNVYLWYDSFILKEGEEDLMTAYIDSIDRGRCNVFLCDFRHYDLLHADPIFGESYKVYEYEVGLQTRYGLKDDTREIKNWGMASDILRVMILYLYGGFYMDFDMKPVDLCTYNQDRYIRSCPKRQCQTTYGHPRYENYDSFPKIRADSFNNNAMYMHPSYDVDFARIFFEDLFKRYTQYVFSNSHYYLIWEFIPETLSITGPGMIHTALEPEDPIKSYFDYSYLFKFDEDLNKATKSWQGRRGDALLNVYYEVLSNIDILYSCLLSLQFHSSTIYSYDSRLSVKEVGKQINQIDDSIKRRVNDLPNELWKNQFKDIDGLLNSKMYALDEIIKYFCAQNLDYGPYYPINEVLKPYYSRLEVSFKNNKVPPFSFYKGLFTAILTTINKGSLNPDLVEDFLKGEGRAVIEEL